MPIRPKVQHRLIPGCVAPRYVSIDSATLAVTNTKAESGHGLIRQGPLLFPNLPIAAGLRIHALVNRLRIFQLAETWWFSARDLAPWVRSIANSAK